jgi:glycine/D-amino acid oxidase-like deaminating enzyme
MGEPIAIIGAGITGLAAAYILSTTHKVTIIARDLPGDLGLNWASPWFEPPLLQTHHPSHLVSDPPSSPSPSPFIHINI